MKLEVSAVSEGSIEVRGGVGARNLHIGGYGGNCPDNYSDAPLDARFYPPSFFHAPLHPVSH